ncbi:hypothetical protein [Dyella sp. ASV21]|uniref:hypothetical protein n=1 Tax=Dyella sp. ASV21 TaxID=2795114 RepID=UPI0018EBB2E9|nr:hypothetical protein [Dyella sp. ASV21]
MKRIPPLAALIPALFAFTPAARSAARSTMVTVPHGRAGERAYPGRLHGTLGAIANRQRAGLRLGFDEHETVVEKGYESAFVVEGGG